MNFKRISAALLALAMTASTAAFAAEDAVPTSGLLISPNPNAGYDTVITINGEVLESYEYTRDIPDTWETETITVQLADIADVPTGYVPLRAVAQADHGSASWYKDENQSFFYFNGTSIITDFNDMSIEVDGEKVEGAEALLIKGVTYVPVSVLRNIEGVTVTDNSADGVESYEISTPNGTPLMKTAYQVMEDADMGSTMKQSVEEIINYYGENFGFNAEMMTEGVGFFPMMINADALILFRMADESKQEEIRAAFEAYKANELERCSWGYLVDNLPIIENAQIAFEGDWALFLIAEDAEAGVETFRAAVQAMSETQE